PRAVRGEPLLRRRGPARPLRHHEREQRASGAPRHRLPHAGRGAGAGRPSGARLATAWARARVLRRAAARPRPRAGARVATTIRARASGFRRGLLHLAWARVPSATAGRVLRAVPRSLVARKRGEARRYV